MNMPRVVVDTSSGLAPWRQIHQQLVRMIAARVLGPGTRLPTIRQLARDLGVAAGTVARVYRELESAELVVTARGRGTVVADGAPAAGPWEPWLATAAAAYVCDARAHGADVDAAVAAVLAAWNTEPG
jgi:DNA-binding transcriptional regulator YhcF (GntR family)